MDYLARLESALRPHANPQRAKANTNCRNSPMKTLGISVPVQRKIMASFLRLERKEWGDIFLKAQTHEARNVALMGLAEMKATWPLLKRLATEINNWEHSDRLADLIAKAHEVDAALVYPTLAKWNGSTNAWLRRLSITSLFYYSRSRKQQPKIAHVLPLVENLLDDRHPYVTKAVGWTLREAGNVYPKETLIFLKRHICRLAPVAFSYATEKLDRKSKEELKQLRSSRSCG